jgi:hypothetical protein
MRKLSLLLVLFVLAACDSNNNPVAPIGTTANSIETAQVLVNGTPAQNGVVRGEAGQTMFQIHLQERDALHLEMVEHCEVRYDRPGGMGAMSPHRQGQALCYDDGTHGDGTPGDGIYHYLDSDDTIGCGRAGMPVGEYAYQFHCQFNDGSTSETTATVTRQ